MQDLATAWGVGPVQVYAAKFVLAALGLLVVSARVLLAPRNAPRLLRVVDALLAALGVLGFAAFFNFGLFHFFHMAHRWDVTHYYLGAKYAPELGYTRLYACIAVAESQAALVPPGDFRPIRNLTTNQVGSTSEVLRNPGPSCTDAFQPDRWEMFRDDVVFLSSIMSRERWRLVILDHGYNPPPSWGIVPSLMIRFTPISAGQLLILILLDPALLVLMWIAVGKAFGWRVAAVGALFMGANGIVDYGWLGGGILRQDYFVLLVLSICQLRRKKTVLAGALFGGAVVLRIFPGLLALAFAATEVVRMIRTRKESPGDASGVFAEFRSFVLGAIAAAATMALVGGLLAGGIVSSWRGFVSNSQRHLGSVSVNVVGLKSALTYERAQDVPAGQPYRTSLPEAQRRALSRRLPLGAAIVLSWLALFLLTGSRLPRWAALALSLTALPFLPPQGNYYYVILTALATLAHERARAAIPLLALACVTSAGIFLFPSDLLRYSIASGVVVAAVLAIVLSLRGKGEGLRSR